MSGPLQSIGSIASEFSRGYLQGRMMKQQQHATSLQEKQQHIENLSRLSEIHRNNPSMRETIDSQLETAIHDLESSANGAVKKPPKEGSAGSLFSTIKNFFSGGDKKPQAAPGTPWESLMPEADKESTGVERTAMGPKPAGPDSRTYGDMGEYFGQATRMPESLGVGQLADGTGGSTPVSVTPVSTPPMASALPKPPAIDQNVANTYTNVVTPEAGQAVRQQFQLRTPSQIRQQALTKESTPKYGYYDANKVQQRSTSDASEFLDEALGMAEAALDHNPHLKTFEQATADPTIGPTFRQLMDYAARLEGSGLIEKGYVDQWKQNRFPDVRQGYQQPKRPDQMSLEQQADAGFAKPAKARTPEDLNAIAGYMEALKVKADSQPHLLSPRETAYKTAYEAEIKKGRTPMQAYTEMARADNTPTQPKRDLVVVNNPRTQQNEYAWITEGQANPQFTGLASPTQFNISSLKTSKPAYANYPGPNGTTIPIQSGTTQDYDPVEVIEAVKRGNITGAAAKLIVDTVQDPAAKAKIQDFLQNPGKF